MGMNAEVRAYVDNAPEEQRVTLRRFWNMIRKHLPNAVEAMDSGFPVYKAKDGEWLAGFASRKKGAMFYLMDSAILDQHAKRLGRLRSGKSCIEYRESKSLTLDDLHEIIDAVLAETAAKHRG